MQGRLNSPLVKGGYVMEEKQIMNADECAEFLSVEVHTIYKMCKSKTIPFRKVGREYRFSRNALLNWLDNHQNGNTENLRRIV